INRKVDQVSAGEADVIVYGEVRDDEALAAYKAHPNYAACIDRVRPLREMRITNDLVYRDKPCFTARRRHAFTRNGAPCHASGHPQACRLANTAGPGGARACPLD